MKFFRSCALALLLALSSAFTFAHASGSPPVHSVPMTGIGIATVEGVAHLVPIRFQGLAVENLNAVAFIGVGGSASVSITYLDSNAHTANVGTSESVTLTVTTTAKSLPFLMAAASASIPRTAQGAIMRIISGTIAVNRNGTADGAAGAGNGFAVSSDAPTSSSTETFTAGQLFLFGQFSHAQYVTVTNTASIAGTVTANQGTAGVSAWPISAATLPLPSGAATSANQTTANASLVSILTALAGGLPVALDGSGFLKVHEQGTAAVSASTLPLPAGASTSANQATANTSLSSIVSALNGGLPASLDGIGNLKVHESGTGNFNLSMVNGIGVAVAANGIQKVGLTDVSGNGITSNSGSLNINSPDSTMSGSLSATGSVAVTPPGGDATWTFYLSGTLTGTAVFEGTLDGSNYFNLYATRIDTQANTPVTTVTGAAGTGANGAYKSFTSGLTSVRVRVSAYTSGTLTAYMRISSGAGPMFELYPLPPGSNTIGNVGVADGQSVTLGTTTDASTATTVIGRLQKLVALVNGGLPAALDGSGFLKTHEQGTATVTGTVTSNAGSGTFNISAAPANAGVNIGAVTHTVSTSGGITTFSAVGSLSNTAVTVKSGATNIYCYYLYNPGAAVAYVEFWNLAAGSVTLGTTSPSWIMGIPAGGAANLSFVAPLSFGTAFSWAAVATAGGSGAPGSAIIASVGYN